MKKGLIKFLAIFGLVLPIVFFLHTGFLTDSPVKNLQAVFFAAAFALLIVWPIYKKYVFLISAILLIGMAPFFMFNIMAWADILGSTGIGLILLLLISYMPQLVKKGYVEKM